MRKIIKILLKIALVLLVIFWISLVIDKKTEPQREMEDKARMQAQKYLDTIFTDEHYVIYNMTFDPSHSLYDYAAEVRNEENNIEFRVFLNNHTGKMEDDYVAMKWKDDLTDDILPFIQAKFGKDTGFYVGYDEMEINRDPNNPGDYKDFNGKPIISVFVKHPKKAENEKDQDELINFLKEECGLKHAQVQVSYYKNQELIMEEGWFEEF